MGTGIQFVLVVLLVLLCGVLGGLAQFLVGWRGKRNLGKAPSEQPPRNGHQPNLASSTASADGPSSERPPKDGHPRNRELFSLALIGGVTAMVVDRHIFAERPFGSRQKTICLRETC